MICDTGNDLPGPFASRAAAPSPGPRGPRNLAFADGLDGWHIGGSSRAEITGAHWDDYTAAAADGAATLSAAVPQPYGDIFLRQSWTAGDYRGPAPPPPSLPTARPDRESAVKPAKANRLVQR